MKILAVVLLTSAVIGCATPALPANVSVVPDPVDFGSVYVGDPKSMSATLTNSTGNQITVRDSTLGPGTVFAIVAPPPKLPQPVANNGTLAFPFTFTPPSKGSFQGAWNLTLDTRPYAIDLKGDGVLAWTEGLIGASGQVTPDGLDFGDVPVGTAKDMVIRLRNVDLAGGAAIVFAGPPAVAPAGPFTIKTPAAGVTIKPTDAVKITVTFAPTAVGHFTATLTWQDTTKKATLKVFLAGNGIAGE